MLFIDFIINNSSIFDEDLTEFIKNNESVLNLINYMEDFCISYDITLDIEKNNSNILIDTFSGCILTLYKHINMNTGWAKSSLDAFMNTVRKILELLAYIINLNDETINEIYLDDFETSKEQNYYNYLSKMAKMNNQNFKIIDGKVVDSKKYDRKYILLKNFHNEKKVAAKYVYRPIGNHNLTAPTSNQNFLEFYFNTKESDDNSVWRIFNLSHSKGNQRKSKGGFRGKSISLEEYEIINFITPKDIDLSQIDSSESREEITEIMSEKEVLSPSLSEETAKDVSETFGNAAKVYSTLSPYKQFLINKAISNSYINKNLNYRNDNTKPSLPKLNKFLKYFLNKNEDKILSDILILSIIFGFSIEKLIYSVLGLDKDVQYKKNKNSFSKLAIHINPNMFSMFEDMKKFQIASQSSSVGEIYLIESIEKKWLSLKNKLESYIIKQMTTLKSDDNLIALANEYYNNELPFLMKDFQHYIKICEELNDFEKINLECEKNLDSKFIFKIEDIDFINYYIKKFVTTKKDVFEKIKNKYGRAIKLDFGNIHTLFLFYYRIYNPTKNEFSILITKKISKNDETRLKYASIPNRLIAYEQWIIKLIIYLDLDQHFNYDASKYIPQTIDYEKRIGSNNFILPHTFKNFILQLNYLNFDDEIICLNICMIYLRYIFSIQLVSRDIIETSTNLSQFSSYLNIVTIQEKNNSLYAGKKILPLTSRAIKNINVFYALKEKYQLLAMYPVLLKKTNEIVEEIPATRTNIHNFFVELNKKYPAYISKDILIFTKYTKLNLGRHIITSQMLSRNIDTSIIDACMNHYILGKEDQGKYSLFNNQKYENVVQKTITEIENEYLPSKISIEDFLWNLKV